MTKLPNGKYINTYQVQDYSHCDIFKAKKKRGGCVIFLFTLCIRVQTYVYLLVHKYVYHYHKKKKLTAKSQKKLEMHHNGRRYLKNVKCYQSGRLDKVKTSNANVLDIREQILEFKSAEDVPIC
ncbi:hypothetical protein RFI_04172, partial [Reticulomyxa filosa]